MSAVVTSIICGIIINISIFIITKRILNSSVKLINAKTIILLLILSLIYAVFYNQKYNVTYVLTNYLSILLFNKLLFKENMTKVIMSTFISLLIIMVADFINSMIMINFFSYENIRGYWYIRILSNIIVSAISIIISHINIINKKCRYFIKKIGNNILPIIVLFVVLIISLILITYNMSGDYRLNISYLANVFIILCLVLFCYIFINENNEYNRLTDEYDNLFNCIQTFEDWIEKEQLNRHEYKNQLAAIRYLTKEKKVKDKIDSIMLDNINITNDTVNYLKSIPNGGLKGLLYYKISIAESNKLNVELDISIKNPKKLKKLTEEQLKILCRLVGIYLDNAIESAKGTKKKIISIEIYEVDNYTNIVITNTFNNKVDISKRNEYGFTTKGKGHGKGLYFANKMIEKNTWLSQKQSIVDNYYIQKLIIE